MVEEPDENYSVLLSNVEGPATLGVSSVTTTIIDDDENQGLDAANDAFSTAFETAVGGNVLPNDSDPENDPLTVTTTGILTTANGGAATIDAAGNFTYSPPAGFSGADLANLLNEGALIAARRHKKMAERIDLDDAREKISFGTERRRVMDDEDRKIIAYHEAGHAIVQAIVDDGLLPIHKVTIIPRGQSLGSTMFTPKKDILNHSKRRVLNQVCCAMGGRAADPVGSVATDLPSVSGWR